MKYFKRGQRKRLIGNMKEILAGLCLATACVCASWTEPAVTGITEAAGMGTVAVLVLTFEFARPLRMCRLSSCTVRRVLMLRSLLALPSPSCSCWRSTSTWPSSM